MKLHNKMKYLAVVLLPVFFFAGCASQQQQEAPPAKVDKGPSASSIAIADAKASINKAKSLGYLWRDTEKMLKKAEKLASEGKEDAAVKAANAARTQAELAVKQYYVEQGMDRSLPSNESSSMSYGVIKGDSLWRIAGKQETYANPYQWPLIYKSNSDKIKDADLIYPGQQFDINTSPAGLDVDAAINHAKTRGAWSIGVSEDSDKAYLAK
jgi:nucleoid-associated protein YgaU